MQNVAYNLVDILSGSVRDFVPGDLIEFYAPDETELVPGNAVKRFANTKLVWYGWQYEQQAISRGSTNRYIDERFNTVNLTFSNIDREVGRWLSSTVIAGYRVLIRAVSRSVADESIVLFIGRCEKPFSVTNSTISLTIKQDLGSINSELPARKFTHACPLKFKGTECQGGQNPGQKSAAYNNAGTCDKSWQQCTSYANTDFFQGFRNTNVTGSFVLRERGMIGTTKSTKQWSSQDMTAINEPVPMGLGRTQIELTPVASADTGQFLYGHWVAGEGPIRKFLNTRNVTPGFKRRFEGQNEDGTPTGSGSYREHLGNYGNVAGQRSTSDFLGFAAYSRRAFIEGTIEGQNPDTGDPAPTIVSTVLWNPIPTPTADLKYGQTEWTDNPVHQVRYLLTDERTLNYPANLIDDETAIQTAQYCDEPLYDKSGGEDLVVAQNSDTTDASFLNGRFRSTGLIDPFYWRRRRVSTEPESAERRPNITYFPTEEAVAWDEFGQPIYRQIPPPANLVPNEYYRKRYTANWHLKKTIKVADFLFRQLLPSFKGYLVTGADGRLQIRSERAAVQSRSTGAVTTAMNTIDVLDGVQFKDLNLPVRYVLIRNPESRITRATIRRVVGVDYLTASSAITIGAPSSGASTMNCIINGRIEIRPPLSSQETGPTSTLFSNNSTNTAAFAYITVTDGLAQTATAGVRIDGVDVGAGGPVGTTAAYASQNWSPEIAAMIATNLNANPNLRNVNGVALRDYIEAVWDPANPLMVLFRSKQATLILDRPFTVNHPAGDLVTHFHLAFSDGSDGLVPNILKDSFEWPLGNRQSAYNQFSLTYQDAVQDGQSIALIENDYEHQESTNQINKLEVPGGDCVDNYHQADRLLLAARYKYRESDFFVQFQTAGLGMLLEEGDLILVNHSSMPSYQNYLYRIEELSVSQDHRVSIIARLYSDVQYPEQPVAKTVPLIRSNAWQTTTLPAVNNLVVTRLPNAGNTARIQFRFPSAIDEPYVRVFARRRDASSGEFIDAALVDTGLILYPDASNNGAVEIPGLVTGSIVELVPFTSTGLRGDSIAAAIPALSSELANFKTVLTAPRTYFVGFALGNVSSFTVANPGTVNLNSHGLRAGDPVVFSPASGAVLPGGITAGQVYYVSTENLEQNSFRITSNTDGSNPQIQFTGSPSGSVGVHTGNDGNVGFGTNGRSVALLTIQKAIDLAASLDITIFDVTIQVCDGLHLVTTSILPKSCVGAGSIIVRGNTTTPANAIVRITSGTVSLWNQDGVTSSYQLRGLNFQSTTGLFAINCARFSNLSVGKMRFSNTTGTNFTNIIVTAVCASIIVDDDLDLVSVGTAATFAAVDTAVLRFFSPSGANIAITLVDSPTAPSSAFIAAARLALIRIFGGITFTGAFAANAALTRAVTANAVLSGTITRTNDGGGGIAAYTPTTGGQIV
jgi:hypothetical protein